ncbi:MqnA/MqnD/SBP family protein [Hydrogenimonas cancrithermarum]|uniref:Chorismate dehydratase n=1 Tax=Hydrogenimonas cancrithermarum TaxID=2993563 RepID=A0ABM8FKW1_9BACT|nr:MqnA/MqnD/SBP family protein [Hydrogenimonas cancrithermarum]BDY12831.1 chorismate dehydratase [Hydrogenimonas cancrithermarum]BDY12948.1 chorismate dehydratase [Hydrogenimonas cancrithermarum]
MIFGKIEYLNLLPFHLFLKRALRHGIEKKAWQKRGSVPSRINRAFEARRVDAAVISSIKSRGRECTDFGIVADGEVMSVLVLPGKSRRDTDSDTSNALASLLGIEGEVMIGDKALRYRLANPGEGIDLAEAWKERTGLPFVFARLCAHSRHIRRLRRLTQRFFTSPPKIPYRILRREAKARGLNAAELRNYLNKIYYRLGWREKRALKRFLRNERRGRRKR